MTNLIAVFRLRGSAQERSLDREVVGTQLATHLVQAKNGPSHVTLLVGITEPVELRVPREEDDYSPPFDFAVKLSAPSSALREAARAIRVDQRCADWSAYQVEEIVKLDSPPAVRDGKVAGVHMLHPLYFHDDLSETALRRSWTDLHGELALRIHIGASSYRQHLVREVVTTGIVAPFGGFSEFHFPSHRALVEGYFESERGRLEVRHDIKHFIKGFPPRLFAQEFRLTSTR